MIFLRCIFTLHSKRMSDIGRILHAVMTVMTAAMDLLEAISMRIDGILW